MSKVNIGCPHAHGHHENATIEGEGPINDQPAGFRFGRIVPRDRFQPLTLKESHARLLGREMVKRPPVAKEEDRDSKIPAGYTYFGQFVDHDITLDTNEIEGDDPTTDVIERTKDSVFSGMQGRSPSLDLDSLYGHPDRPDSSLFIPGTAKFIIGRTVKSPFGGGHSQDKNLVNDLPRIGLDGTSERGEITVTDQNGQTRKAPSALLARIPDRRNDENLAVAQTHLMWMLFHNNIVGALESMNPQMSAPAMMAEARRLVTLHYQHIVLHDFVRRLIPDDIYQKVVVGGERSLLHCGPGETPFMPLEFSVAAYRLGHSMVRETYDWNLVFEDAGFDLLFRFSGTSGTMNGPGSAPEQPGDVLPTNWIADFRRLYDLKSYKPSHLSKASKVTAPNMARKIDPYLAPDLATLPAAELQNLAFLNLRRGALRDLPSGQDMAREVGVKALTRKEMEAVFKKDPTFDQVMAQHDFYRRTPLWLYILIEAASQQKGDRLGELGGLILAETFVSLALCSRISIFDPAGAWTPAQAETITRPVTPITDIAGLLEWIDRAEPIVNPLEDLRNGELP